MYRYDLVTFSGEVADCNPLLILPFLSSECKTVVSFQDLNLVYVPVSIL